MRGVYFFSEAWAVPPQRLALTGAALRCDSDVDGHPGPSRYHPMGDPV